MNYLIIPAYQPDLNLVKLVRLVHAKSDLHIIVVDDGSDADKKAIFDKLDGLATVLTHEHNQGKGQSLKTAYAYILERGTYGSIVTADADGQHKIWDIFRVVNQSQEHPGTLILGARAFSCLSNKQGWRSAIPKRAYGLSLRISCLSCLRLKDNGMSTK